MHCSRRVLMLRTGSVILGSSTPGSSTIASLGRMRSNLWDMPEFQKYAIIVMGWYSMAETVVLGESGRIVLPVAIRRKYGLKGGDRLTVIEEDGSIRLLSMKMALEEVRASIVAHRGSLKGILDEFLEERHDAARREASGE